MHACAHTDPKVENEIFINIIYKSNKQYEKLGNKFNKICEKLVHRKDTTERN